MIPSFTGDVNIISSLSDAPVVDQSLTEDQFKAKFDEAANLIKTYINNVLIPGLVQSGNGVSADKVKNGAITTASIAAGAVTAALLAAGSVTKEKLGSDVDYTAVGLNENQVQPIRSLTVTIPTAWDGNHEIHVAAEGVTADNLVIVTPTPESYVAWSEALVRCTGQDEGYLTFKCEDVPEALSANVLIVG